MTQDERNTLIDRLDSIATLAIQLRDRIGQLKQSHELAEIQDTIDAIGTDTNAVTAIVQAYIDPTDHTFLASPAFGDCCRVCGENEGKHAID